MSTTQAFGWISAAGNRFALHDDRQTPLADPARTAMELEGVDGLLLMAQPKADGACRMIVYNRDGSRAEACGNGLRAIALFARQRGIGGNQLRIETDAGTRTVRLLEEAGEVVAARSSMGSPRSLGTLVVEVRAGTKIGAERVDCGNPHLVLFLDACDDALVEAEGPSLENDPRFPKRTNVEFVVRDGDELVTRVWERGVGETAACGTGAVAVAYAARRRGVGSLPFALAIRMPGGLLRVTFEGEEAWLEGPVSDHPAGF